MEEYKIVEEEVVEEKEYVIPTPAALIPLIEENWFLPCIFGFEPWCWVRKYKDPVINFVIHAIEVSDANAHLLKGEIDGTITTLFQNKSEEGWTWLYNVKTHEVKDKHKVKGSADLSGNFKENIVVEALDEVLCKIKNTISKTKPGKEVKIKTTFKKKGYMKTIVSILEILLTGHIYVDDEVNVKVEYQWKGDMHVVEKKIKIKAWLPVKNVHFSFS